MLKTLFTKPRKPWKHLFHAHPISTYECEAPVQGQVPYHHRNVIHLRSSVFSQNMLGKAHACAMVDKENSEEIGFYSLASKPLFSNCTTLKDLGCIRWGFIAIRFSLFSCFPQMQCFPTEMGSWVVWMERCSLLLIVIKRK